jgi:hypothetical protein
MKGEGKTKEVRVYDVIQDLSKYKGKEEVYNQWKCRIQKPRRIKTTTMTVWFIRFTNKKTGECFEVAPIHLYRNIKGVKKKAKR